jgi:predicted nucleotidyltransferase
MPRIEPTLVPVVADVERGLRQLGVPFGVVGALVPELLLDVRPARLTNDADVMVIVQTLADFETLKDQLAAYGFERTRVPHRLRHTTGGLLDILPYSESIAPEGRLELQDGFVFNMAGFRYVVPSAVQTTIDGGLTLPLAPLPLYAVLKLVAFSDRKAAKDLGGVLHCLEHYLEDDERRYGIEFEGSGVPYDYTCAHLLGLDSRPFLDDAVVATVTAVLERLDDPEAELVGTAAAETGRLYVQDEHRTQVFELFRWYRLGTGL